ncbi:ATP-binding cassette domain-containing protein [Micromonospora sp. CPCC 205371]|nr:ATP-binding cassette domain-containing protein [Micromonospora sp. CPCC 205371]
MPPFGGRNDCHCFLIRARSRAASCRRHPCRSRRTHRARRRRAPWQPPGAVGGHSPGRSWKVHIAPGAQRRADTGRRHRSPRRHHRNRRTATVGAERRHRRPGDRHRARRRPGSASGPRRECGGPVRRARGRGGRCRARQPRPCPALGRGHPDPGPRPVPGRAAAGVRGRLRRLLGRSRSGTRTLATRVRAAACRARPADTEPVRGAEPPDIRVAPGQGDGKASAGHPRGAQEVRVADRLRHDVSLHLESGSRLVVTGPKGAGKSTLLAVLAGTLAPTSGTVRHAPNARVRLLAQESAAADSRNAREVFSSGVPDTETVSLTSLGLLSSADLDRPVRELSMGQQRRLDLAMALASRPHVLLLDEPTNHLSIALVDELTDALRATDAAVVLATHDRQLQRDTASWPRLSL